MTDKNKPHAKAAWHQSLWTRLLSMPLIVFVLVTLLAYGSYSQFLEEEQKQILLQQQQSTARSYVDKVQGLQAKQQQFEQFQAEYQSPAVQSLLQSPNRALWVDQLSDWTQEQYLPGLNLQFSAEQAMRRTPQASETQRRLLYRTDLRLNLQLQTEEDFFNLMDAIDRRITQNYSLDSCQLNLQNMSVNHQPRFNPNQGNLQLNCTFHLVRAQPHLFDAGPWR